MKKLVVYGFASIGALIVGYYVFGVLFFLALAHICTTNGGC